ncbi:MAG TPA: transglycosylase SLT domain-containing protein [Longimicrobiaceae bacterium]|nr:transglycosylase SLT domain-containing protein [Longimicrobiaceae bacterium]
MPRTQLPAAVAALVLLLGACAPGARHPVAPVPLPVAAVAESEPAPEVVSAPEPAALEKAAPTPEPQGILGTATYDLPVTDNRWVEMELDFLVTQRHEVIARWLANAERFGAWVQDVFARHGLPRDLHHLAMVESGYSPHARSRAGAVGMWQFMRGTGRMMGLRVDTLVDERMDPVRATHAAARHLLQLHRQFGRDWALAAAAYNAGGGRIGRALGRTGARDFWELSVRGDLAQETRRYVPRLYAVTIIAKDPARFGFAAPQVPARPFAYDSVRVDLLTPLAVLARLGSVPLDLLAELNPHLLRQAAPAGYWVWVPAGEGAALQRAYVDSEFRRRGGHAFYTVRAGDDLATLAEVGAVPVEEIRELNLSRNLDRLSRGERLRLPADAARALAARPRSR